MTFEPAIESICFNLITHKHNNFWDVKLLSDDSININLSQACIVGLKDTIDFLTKIENQKENNNNYNHMHIDYKPYKIVNNTELNLSFCLSGLIYFFFKFYFQGLNSKNMVSVLQNQTEELSFPTNLDLNSHLIDIYFDNFTPLNYLQIDELGTHKFRLFSLKENSSDIIIMYFS